MTRKKTTRYWAIIEPQDSIELVFTQRLIAGLYLSPTVAQKACADIRRTLRSAKDARWKYIHVRACDVTDEPIK